MRLLLDTCIWFGARDVLAATGHDVVWSGDWPHDPGDDEILAYAHREGRILVTLDKDFGELAVAFGRPHSGIVRLVNWRVTQQATVCAEVLDRYGGELQDGAIVTAEPGRIRVRPAAD